MYMIVSKYTNDPERKKIEYIFEKFKDIAKISKPDGMVTFVDSEDLDEILRELYSRIPKENIEIYKIDKTEFEIEKEHREIKLILPEKKEVIEKFIGFMMAKRSAALEYELKELNEKKYNVYTKKGKAEILVRLREKEGKNELYIKIEAFGNAKDLLYKEISNDLEYFKEGMGV